MSQDTVSATLAPLAKPSTPLTVVATSTSITSPRRGSLVTVRVSWARDPRATTLVTGPMQLTSCVIG
jgi:hypothetical protein